MPLSTGLSVDTSGKKMVSQTSHTPEQPRPSASVQLGLEQAQVHTQDSIKQFFDEMFGDEFAGQMHDNGGEKHEQGVGLSNTSPGKITPRKPVPFRTGGYFSRDAGANQDSDSFEDQAKEYEADLLELIRSPFPRINELREALASGGYVPAHLRGTIWSLMLTGTVQEDHEVAFFST